MCTHPTNWLTGKNFFSKYISRINKLWVVHASWSYCLDKVVLLWEVRAGWGEGEAGWSAGVLGSRKFYAVLHHRRSSKGHNTTWAWHPLKFDMAHGPKELGLINESNTEFWVLYNNVGWISVWSPELLLVKILSASTKSKHPSLSWWSPKVKGRKESVQHKSCQR